MKKANIDGKLMDVVSLSEYTKNPDLYSTEYTAIEFDDINVVLPIKNKNQFDKQSPGVIIKSKGLFHEVVLPKDEVMDKYSMDHVIDLSDASSIGELMKKQQQIKDIEHDMLTTIDNKFQPKIGENDSPAMKALKTAVIEKGIDINKYAPRFKDNFGNDKRHFVKDKISMQMLERLCKGLDIRATLTLEDMNEDVPNPIGRQITVDLTDTEASNDDE